MDVEMTIAVTTANSQYLVDVTNNEIRCASHDMRGKGFVLPQGVPAPMSYLSDISVGGHLLVGYAAPDSVETDRDDTESLLRTSVILTVDVEVKHLVVV